MRSFVVALAASLASAAAARANDSTAELAAGGLKFLQETDIAMKSEDLFISASGVHVDYEFFNASGADKTALIAFPMPDITGSGDFMVGIPSEDAANPFAFHVKADGVEVTPQLDARAFLNGVEQTALLGKLGVPLRPDGPKTGAALDALDAATKQRLTELGMAFVDEYSTRADGKMERHLVGLWTYRSAFTWRQTFPAGKTLRLEQAYLPSVGSSAGTEVSAPGWRNFDETKAYPAKYCIDAAFEASVAAATRRARKDVPPFGEQRIDYILTTGANWAGPIGDFHLTIDKGQPKNLVSFCADGVAKTGPTRFETRKKDFTPTRDLNILILAPYPAP